jgi:exonuclease III
MYPTPLSSERYYTYKIATLNINDLTAPTKLEMLGDFLRTQKIDILCLQEVPHLRLTI